MKKAVLFKVLIAAALCGAAASAAMAAAPSAVARRAGSSFPAGPSRLTLVEDAGAGTLTVREGSTAVLTYRFGDKIPAGADPRYIRSCYIHPLYALDGEVLTDDSPRDHFHHHGLFWGWPVVMTRGLKTSNWEPAVPPLRQRFTRWLKREVRDGEARIVAENAWKLGSGKGEVVAVETVTIFVHPADGGSRAIDMELVIRPVGGPLELRGAPEENKGYGGLCLRGAPLFKGAALTTDLGPLETDAVNRRLHWADLSAPGLGVAIFVAPGHPGDPVAWLVRNSYAGILNPSWPALEGAVVTPDKPAALRYRVFVHRGDAAAGGVKEAYERYAAAEDKKPYAPAPAAGLLKLREGD